MDTHLPQLTSRQPTRRRQSPARLSGTIRLSQRTPTNRAARAQRLRARRQTQAAPTYDQTLVSRRVAPWLQPRHRPSKMRPLRHGSRRSGDTRHSLPRDSAASNIHSGTVRLRRRRRRTRQPVPAAPAAPATIIDPISDQYTPQLPLPPELWAKEILTHLDDQALAHFARATKEFRALVLSEPALAARYASHLFPAARPAAATTSQPFDRTKLQHQLDLVSGRTPVTQPTLLCGLGPRALGPFLVAHDPNASVVSAGGAVVVSDGQAVRLLAADRPEETAGNLLLSHQRSNGQRIAGIGVHCHVTVPATGATILSKRFSPLATAVAPGAANAVVSAAENGSATITLHRDSPAAPPILTAQLRKMTGTLTHMAWSPDGRYLVLATTDSMARHDLTAMLSGKPDWRQLYKTRTGRVTWLSARNDGSALFGSSRDNKVRVRRFNGTVTEYPAEAAAGAGLAPPDPHNPVVRATCAAIPASGEPSHASIDLPNSGLSLVLDDQETPGKLKARVTRRRPAAARGLRMHTTSGGMLIQQPSRLWHVPLPNA